MKKASCMAAGIVASALTLASIPAAAQGKINSINLQGNLTLSGENKSGQAVVGYGRLIGQWQLDVFAGLSVDSSDGDTVTSTMAAVGARYYGSR